MLFQIDSHAQTLYDAIYLYALALDDAMEHGAQLSDPNSVTKYLFGKSFIG